MKTALITGASGGIGEQFAWLCAERGYDVIIVARNEAALQQIKTGIETTHRVQVRIIAMDLALPDAAKKLADAVADTPIDLLINNAGLGGYGLFAEADAAQDRSMILLNVLTLTELTKLILPSMIARRSGRILNVGSVAAYQAGPLMAVYYATKAYVLSFSHALVQELKGTGVTVTCLSPGPTRTGFAKGAHLEASKLFQGQLMDPRTVAEAGLRACLAGKAEVIPGLTNKLGAFATRLVPRTVAAKIAKFIQEKA